MAAAGTVYLPAALETADISQDSDLSTGLRNGFAAFSPDGHEDFAIRPEWYWAGRNHAVLGIPSGWRTANGAYPDCYTILYNNTLLLPAAVNVQTIASSYEGEFFIWNSGYEELRFSVHREGWEGIEDNIHGDSLTLGPLCDRVVHFVVTLDGPSIMDASITFSAGDDAVAFRITGQRGLVFPFRPNKGFTETWEWKTEVQSTWDFSEHRLALRRTPRQACELGYTLEGSLRTLADMMLYDMSRYTYTLPRFEQGVPAHVVAGSEVIACDVGYANWKSGDRGLVWASPQKKELFIVAEVGASSLRLVNPITQNLGQSMVLPCTSAKMVAMSREDRSIPLSDFSISFRLEEPPDWPVPDDSEVAQLDGHDLWELPLCVSDTLSRTLECPTVTLDNGIGTVRTFHAQPSGTGHWQVMLPCDGLDEIMAARGFLLRRQGCVRPFWMSTRRHDFIPATIVRAGADSILVEGCTTGTSAPARSLRKRLRIELSDGRVLYRGLIGLFDVDGDTNSLKISEPLDGNDDLDTDAFARISFLTLVRLASDKVEWTWQSTDRADVAFAVQEIVL